jgi:hypothetical protein
MKLINKMLAIGMAAVLGLAACEKTPELPMHQNGKTPDLAASASSVAPLPSDSNKNVLAFTWNNPYYATDSNRNRYIIQIDSAGRNFSKATNKEVIGIRNLSILGKELNAMLLGYGFEFGKTYNMEARLISSYGNNNDRLITAPVAIKMTPYKVPPKVVLPTTGKLFIIGSATAITNPTNGGWNNPVPTPVQEFTRIDETTFGGIFNLEGGGEYLILPLNGSWDAKYAVADGSLPGLNLGGDFGFNVNNSHNSNFPGPAAAGWYKIILDFQKGKFTVTPFTQQHGLPSQLVIVGDGSPQGWDNSVGNPYKFTRLNATKWEQIVNLTSGKDYLILPEPGNWGKKYGVEDNSIEAAKTAGFVKPEGANFKTPSPSGSYKIVVDFINNAYTVTKQ